MKIILLLKKMLIAISCVFLLAPVSAQIPFCDNFNGGVGNWVGVNATAAVATDGTPSNGTRILTGDDGGGTSFISNNVDYQGAMMPCGGTLCWSFKIITDGLGNTTLNASPGITIYTGTGPNNAVLSATFRANIIVNENSAWVNICAPIGPAVGGVIPAGWTMGNNGTVAQFNTLMNTFTGIAFGTDIDPQPNTGEVIGIDNVCLNPIVCCDPTDTPNFTIRTNCVNGVLVVTATADDIDPQIHQWSLFQTTTPSTSGGILVGSGTGITATFNITDYSKFYYIRHRIWDDCYGWREISIPVNLPQATEVSYYFADEQNNPKTTFCFGETIKMIITGLSNYPNYYLDVWRRPIGSSQNFSWYAGLGWTNGQPTMIDLTAVFAAQNPAVYFDPNFEYEVKLAVANPQKCIAWTEIKRRFTVICCDNFIKADFLLDITPSTNNYQLTAIGFNTYANVGALHEWYVLSSPNQNGGPYTPVTSLTSTTQTSVPLFNNAQYGLYYTVIHKVITKCGEVCIKRTQYQSGLGRAADATSSTQSQVDCCLAFQFWPNGAGTTPTDFTGKFEVGSTPNGNGTYTINTYLANSYSNNPNVTHQWYVFSSPNPSGGPYTLVGQGTGANYSFSPADYGLYYFVIHRVKSPCGDLCYGQSICQNCERAESEACELCGPIDCALVDELLSSCGTPTNLQVDCRKLALTWDAVTGAVQYAVEVSFNDPACCRSGYLPSGFLWNDVKDPYVLFASFSTTKWDCLRWRVKAKCESGESAWSNWVCAFPCREVVVDGSEIGSTGAKSSQNKATIVNATIEPRISPNPSNGDMTLSLQAPGDLVVSVDVINAQGSRVKTIARNTYKGGLFNTKLSLGAAAKGVYTVVFNTNYGTFRKKVIVQ